MQRTATIENDKYDLCFFNFHTCKKIGTMRKIEPIGICLIGTLATIQYSKSSPTIHNKLIYR
jgi:hypothetical protein